MAFGQMSKQDGRRHNSHALYYKSLPPRIAAKKDRNVKRSSHGKFNKVADLVAHQQEIEAKKRPLREEK